MADIPDPDFSEMLGQMLYLDLFNEADVALLGRFRAGGVMVRRRYAKSTRQLVRLVARHQEEASLPLFVGANFEWGTGGDTPSGTLFPGLMAIGATGTERAARDYARVTAREAHAMGINHILGPVLDIAVAGGGSVISTRSLGDNTENVSRLGSCIASTFQSNRLLATAKHFPGSGAMQEDPHVSLPTIECSRKEMHEKHLAPFREAIRAGAGCVMVSQAYIPALMGKQTGPACLSRKMITGILRQEFGFEGLVMTENLTMGAVSLEPVMACAQAIRAGADLLLTRQDAFRPDNFADLLRIVESDRTLTANVRASWKRIMETKKKLGLFRKSGKINADESETVVGAPEHAKAAKRVSLGAITVLKNAGGLLPVKPGRKEKIVVVTPKLPESTLVSVKDTWGHLYKAIKEYHPATSPAYVSHVPTPDETDKAVRAASRADYVIMVIAHEVGQACDGAQTALADAVRKANSRTVTAVLGSPYPAARLSGGDGSVLLSYSNMPQSQVAAAEVILGKARAKGSLPVTL
ncbi:MAG: glycoside hydrolase family 3 C-terminal domain-containing protein [Planctomycetes bacterium]|nr:glycoside hydrolase family 3 C-terminal domain-containing protein [Planctomycetota bacterium]